MGVLTIYVGLSTGSQKCSHQTLLLFTLGSCTCHPTLAQELLVALLPLPSYVGMSPNLKNGFFGSDVAGSFYGMWVLGMLRGN